VIPSDSYPPSDSVKSMRRKTKFKSYVRRTIKSLANLAGYEVAVRGSIARSMQTSLDVSIGLGLNPSTVVDVGVAYGTSELYNSFPKSRFVLIEPIKEWDAHLQRLMRNRRVDFVWAMAGDADGFAHINIQADLGSSSSLRELIPDREPVAVRRVPVVRVDQLCLDLQTEPSYLLKIDVQGAEMSVLQGSEGILNKTDMIIAEVCLQELFEGGAILSDIFKWLDDRDFRIFDVFGSTISPEHGTVWQLDIAAVPIGSGLISRSSFLNR